MKIGVENKIENSDEYNNLINYVLKNVNSDYKIENKIDENNPVFLFEYFVFDLYLPKELLKIVKQPLLAIRFLDFPTQTIEGMIDLNKECIFFYQGKSCFFEMDIIQLKQNLNNEPLYIMFIDMNYGDMKIIASSRVNVSIFAFEHFLLYTGSKPPQARRNILKLFDNVSSKVAEFDISLLIRREYFKYDNKNIMNLKEIYIENSNKTSNNDNDYNHSRTFSKKEQFFNKSKVIKADACVNTNNLEDKLIETNNKTDLILEINPSKQSYVDNLKTLLEGNEKNPPPLYFYNKRKRDTENIVQVYIENNNINNIVKSSVIEDSKAISNQILENREKQKNDSNPVRNKYTKNGKKTMTQLEIIKHNLKLKEEANKIEYIKRVPIKPKYSQSLTNVKISNSNENYDEKMRNIERHNSGASSKNYSGLSNEKSIIAVDDENLVNNEYYNIFSKIKNQSKNAKVIVKQNNKIQKTIESYSDHSIKSYQESINQDKSDKLYDKFYEVSNTNQFEISSNAYAKVSHNELLKSYNSITISNSIPYEIVMDRSSNQAKKKDNKSLNLENNEQIRYIENSFKKENLSRTDAIEEELYQTNQSNCVSSYSRKKTPSVTQKIKDEENFEDYDDFDYDHIELSNKSRYHENTAGDKEESLIEEELVI